MTAIQVLHFLRVASALLRVNPKVESDKGQRGNSWPFLLKVEETKMASYLDLANTLSPNGDLIKRCAFALVVAAEEVKDDVLTKPDGTDLNTADYRLWARYVLDRPFEEAKKALSLTLADNKELSLETIEGVTDQQIQTVISLVIPFLVQARADR